MEIRFKKFKGERVVLDDKSFRDCTFKECELIYSGGVPPGFVDCEVDGGCRWTFDGAASNTVMFLRAMYHGGFRTIVDPTLDRIRTPPDNGVPGD